MIGYHNLPPGFAHAAAAAMDLARHRAADPVMTATALQLVQDTTMSVSQAMAHLKQHVAAQAGVLTHQFKPAWLWPDPHADVVARVNRRLRGEHVEPAWLPAANQLTARNRGKP